MMNIKTIFFLFFFIFMVKGKKKFINFYLPFIYKGQNILCSNYSASCSDCTGKVDELGIPCAVINNLFF